MKRIIALATVIAANKLDKKGATTTVAAGQPMMTCPAGYTAQGNRCAKEVIQPQIPTCSEGILQPDNTCLIIQSPLKACPGDYVSFGTICSRTRTAPATLSCPHGYSFESGHKKAGGVCTRTDSIAQWGCPGGTLQQGDLCVAEQRFPADIQCPQGSIAQGLSCVRSEIYDCTTGPAYVHKHDTHSKKRLLSEQEGDEIYLRVDLSDMDDSAVERELKKLKGNFINTIGGNNHQQEQITVIQQKCERRVSVNPMISCAQGILMGRECVFSQQVKMIPLAPAVNLQTAAPLATCPAAFSPCATGKKKVSSDCCAVEETPAQLQCPMGLELSGETCQTTRAADWICASNGFTKHKHHTDSCVQLQYVDPMITYNQQVTCTGKECTEARVAKHGSNLGGFLF